MKIPPEQVYAFLTNAGKLTGCDSDSGFQSPKTGLCLSQTIRIPTYSSKIFLFQSPKTGLCFSHHNRHIWTKATRTCCFNPLKRVYAFLTNNRNYRNNVIYIMFQSPKTGLFFSHVENVIFHNWKKRQCFNPLKRVYSFLTYILIAQHMS